MAIAMASSEDFPRSDGTKQVTTAAETTKRSSFVPDDEQLFKRKKKINTKQAATKSSKKKKALARKTAAAAKASSAAASNLSKVVIENMTLSRLVEDLIIYGCIQEIDDFELKFSVTGGIVVKVPITNISSPYAKLIEEFASGNASETTEISKLSSFFQIGDYYPIKILSKKVCDQFGHTDIVGSINPKDVYSNFSAKSVNNLPDGYNFLAAVSSLEDYGYEMDLGINGVKAFLPLEDLKKNCGDLSLSVGQLVPCSLLQKNERSIILTTNKKLANFCFDLTHEPSVYSYVPGTRSQCIVTDVHNSGLELSLPGGYKGFVSRYHISDDIITLPKKFKIGDSVEGHVLYVQPHTKQVCMCLKSKLTKKAVKNLINNIQLGLVIKGAVICGAAEFGRMIFKLPSNNYAIALRKNLCEPSEYETMKLNGKFSIGSSHTCRVKQFHLFDNLIEISLKRSFIERKELSPDDLEVGAIVEGTVKKFKENGIYVRLGFGLNGFIPNMHLTDAPLVNLGKNREKLFGEKKRIKCRITKLNTNSRVPKISLTLKKTLLAMDNSEIFSDFADIKPGMSSTGVACLITEKGVLLEFFGGVSGFIPLKYLATYKIEHPEKVFAIGQLIKCTVISVDVRARRMVCSLIDVNETKKLKISTNLTEKKLLNSSLKVGQILKKMKIISKTPMKGFDLTNDKQNIQVFLSLAHMSDDTYLSRLLYTAYKVGDIIDQVMVFSVDSANVVTVTRKDSFIRNKDHLVTSEDDIQMKQPFPAIVRNVTHNGVFFETPNAHFGVIRRKLLQDGFFEEPHKLGLIRGQTIFVSAIDLALLDEEKDKDNAASQLKRYKFSMKLSDVWNRDSEFRVEAMKSFIADYSLAMQLFKLKAEKATDATTDNNQSSVQNLFHSAVNKFVSYSIGQVVTYMVTDITDGGIEVKISLTGGKNEPTVAGYAVKYTDFSELKVAHMGNAIVCDFDFDRKALLVFIQPQPAKIARQVRNSQKTNCVKNIKVGQSIKGTVIYIGRRYVLASLLGHAPGVIAYIPSRRHQNDLGQIESLYSLGEDYHFIVKHIDQNERVIAILNVDNKKTTDAKAKVQEKKAKQQQQQQESVKTKSNSESMANGTEKREKKSQTCQQQQSKEELSSNKPTLANKSNNATSKSTTKATVTTTTSATANQVSQNEFQWDIPDLTPNLSKKRKNEETDLDNLLVNSDSDEESSDNHKKRKTREERNEESRQREFELRQKELELSNTERTPKDKQDFEMAVVASPNSSLVWLKYMSFFLEKGDTAQARAIAERALQRISFREEKEKLNIWIGLMNLENTYGDQTSMDALVERAIKYNDPKTIYLQLASIYNNSNKKEKAEQIHHLTIKKFKQDKSVWIEFLMFYMQNGRLESARKLFQKCLLSLEKRDHVDVISKFAQLEFRYGDSEQAKTIFESMLATYWKRLDQWSVYIDMLVKYTLDESNLDSVEFIRNIFERLITFKLPPQKMKFIFKKYYDFESKYSAENFEILDRIKQKALEYIESDIF